MQPISLMFVPLLLVLLLCAIRIVDAQGTCTCGEDPLNPSTVTGTGNSVSAATLDARKMCLADNNCDIGFKCNPDVCSFIVSSSPFLSGQFTATGTCNFNTTPLPCIAISEGHGDPHLTGFDGSKFDFHGEHGKSYLLFGRPAGDMLVTQMRETQITHHPSQAKATFFDEFGLQPADSKDQINLYMAKSSFKAGHWFPKVIVNAKEIKENLNTGTYRISFRPGGKWVSVITREADYLITVRRSEDEDVHNFNINLKVKGPSNSERYLGILGVTLNRALGHDVHPDLDASSRSVEFETAMRSRFEVESLFPRYNDGQGMVLSGVVRIIADSKNIEKTWTADTW